MFLACIITYNKLVLLFFLRQWCFNTFPLVYLVYLHVSDMVLDKAVDSGFDLMLNLVENLHKRLFVFAITHDVCNGFC